MEITADDRTALEKAAVTFLALHCTLVQVDRSFLHELVANKDAWKFGFDEMDFYYWVAPVAKNGTRPSISPKFDYHDFQALKPRYLARAA
jgi:hypothetical protein